MRKDYIYIGFILFLLLFIIRGNLDIKWKSNDIVKIDSVKVNKEIGEVKGGFMKENPKPMIINNYISNDNQLKKVLKEIEEKYNQKADSIIILRELLQSKKTNKYSEVYEDSIIKATIKTETEGILKSIDFKYTKKPQKITYYEKTTTQKKTPDYAILIGCKINTSTNFSDSSFEVNLGTQFKNGNIIELGYNTNKQISIGYKLNVFRKYR